MGTLYLIIGLLYSSFCFWTSVTDEDLKPDDGFDVFTIVLFCICAGVCWPAFMIFDIILGIFIRRN